MRVVFKTGYMQDIRPWKDGYQLSLYLVLLVAVCAAPWWMDDFYLGELTNVLIWAMAGMGLMLLTGHTGQVSLGHAAFLAFGCYTNAVLIEAGAPFAIAFPAAGILTGIAGVSVAIPALRLHGVYLAIFTLALSVLMDDIIVLAEPLTGGVGGKYLGDVSIFGLTVGRWTTPDRFFWLVLGATVMVTLGYINLLRAPLGRSFIAVRDSEVSAQAMGVDVSRAKTVSFALSCTVAGWAGALMGMYSGAFNNETFNVLISIQLLLMIVIGGLGSIHGAFLGAIVVGFLPQFLSIMKEYVAVMFKGGAVAIPGLETGVFGMILIGFILFEPMGMYGRWLKIRTWLELRPFCRKDMFKRRKSYLKTERLR
ncbi:MAG: branched-chain amino acid ABC transporter permease [Roseovarius sp.]|nr:branched-chain amino acid ABC transporter permease [Roseovarius sp.]MCY4208284.1 branched-chain amino acid ABC transporter permease [Roseovarius sp.]MCY4290497.1 branched-chain amino acid ABC transporter permease [Roseovarius sp.]